MCILTISVSEMESLTEDMQAETEALKDHDYSLQPTEGTCQI